MDLCHWIKGHPELLSVILFSDEASFTRDGVNNVRNVHSWSHENPHETSVTKFQRRFSVNVWSGVLGNRLIGPKHICNHPDNVASANRSLLMRAENCLATGGGHFEQLL